MGELYKLFIIDVLIKCVHYMTSLEGALSDSAAFSVKTVLKLTEYLSCFWNAKTKILVAVLLKKEQVKLVFSDSWHNDRIWKSPPEFLDLSSHPQWYVRSALTVYSNFYFISFYWFEKLHKINVLLSHIIHKQKDKLYHTFSDAHFLSIYFSSTIKSGIASNNANTTVQQQPRIVYQPILDYFLSIRL